MIAGYHNRRPGYVTHTRVIITYPIIKINKPFKPIFHQYYPDQSVVKNKIQEVSDTFLV
jgi:hypothetical protein